MCLQIGQVDVFGSCYRLWRRTDVDHAIYCSYRSDHPASGVVMPDLIWAAHLLMTVPDFTSVFL
jgi:hypothetical protein